MGLIANDPKIMERLSTLTEFMFPVEYLSEHIAILPDPNNNYLKSVYQHITYISD